MSKPPKKVQLSKSNFVERFLHLNNQPISLDLYPHMRTVLDVKPKRNVVLQFARQCTKSTSLANLIIANAILLPHDPTPTHPISGGFMQLFVSPSVDQTKIFSYDRITPPMESPFVKKYYLSGNLVQNVFSKQLLNGSKIYLRYAHLTADRLRGISSDAVFFDEVQDINMDIIYVVSQTMSRSFYKWRHYKLYGKDLLKMSGW
jgi:hypothetical protein